MNVNRMDKHGYCESLWFFFAAARCGFVRPVQLLGKYGSTLASVIDMNGRQAIQCNAVTKRRRHTNITEQSSCAGD